ncbi:hypothetical protein MBLL_00677 (plasmid) [Methylobacterium bullatum]|uniref:Uncharacterized protein n=1 Tax=Methylobacterium bullatum TaxID=570505 RepID=A0A679JXC2_9HYPH|nr:hypothetical protein MBLL_00677 [Methylobacterium bullatum]
MFSNREVRLIGIQPMQQSVKNLQSDSTPDIIRRNPDSAYFFFSLRALCDAKTDKSSRPFHTVKKPSPIAKPWDNLS